MKLPYNTLIAPEKLTQYLLVLKKRNDKSKWLAQAGYTRKNWQKLENDLRQQILPLEVTFAESTYYGQLYQIRGDLIGPNGKKLAAITIWMAETATGVTKFITMYPDKGQK
jgi:hypothetical protein